MRTQLQSLIFEKFGLGCNDLAEGDAGTDGRESDGLRRKGCRETVVGGGVKKKKAKRKRGWVYLNDWGWDPTELFVIERLIGKMVADGGDVPGREGEEIAAETVLEGCGRAGPRRSRRGRRRTRCRAGRSTLSLTTRRRSRRRRRTMTRRARRARARTLWRPRRGGCRCVR